LAEGINIKRETRNRVNNGSMKKMIETEIDDEEFEEQMKIPEISLPK
jgi:hypothetical protein